MKKRASIKRPIIFNSSSNLPFDNFLIQNRTSECDPNFIVKECACGRIVFPSSCMRKDCTKCTVRLNQRRSLNAFNRFQVIKRSRLKARKSTVFCYTDFTIPPNLRQDYSEPQNWQLLRTDLWQLLKRQYGAVFALEGTHPIGDKHPVVFHPHLNFVWMLRDGYRGYIDLDELRGFLRVLLGTLGPVNCHHTYGQDDAQLMHWCQYVTRIFPQFSAWSGHLRWYGRYPKYKQLTDCFCGKCQERLKIIGMVHRFDVQTFEERGFWLGRAPPWENDAKVIPFKKRA